MSRHTDWAHIECEICTLIGSIFSSSPASSNAAILLHIHLLLEHHKAFTNVFLVKWVRAVTQFVFVLTVVYLEHFTHILVVFLLAGSLMHSYGLMNLGIAETGNLSLACLESTSSTCERHTSSYLWLLFGKGDCTWLFTLDRLSSCTTSVICFTCVILISWILCRLENGSSLPSEQIKLLFVHFKELRCDIWCFADILDLMLDFVNIDFCSLAIVCEGYLPLSVFHLFD